MFCFFQNFTGYGPSEGGGGRRNLAAAGPIVSPDCFKRFVVPGNGAHGTPSAAKRSVYETDLLYHATQHVVGKANGIRASQRVRGIGFRCVRSKATTVSSNAAEKKRK